jgi:hypothetical protein
MDLENFKILESIKAQPYELALVVPVLLGLKSASVITLTRDDEQTSSVNQKFQSLGLKTKIEILSENPRVHTIAVAKTAETIKKLAQIELLDDYQHGLILGYPQSAVEAFIKKDLLGDVEEKEITKEMLINFRLSRENWKNELEILKSWNEAVKKHTPTLYQEFLKLDWL